MIYVTGDMHGAEDRLYGKEWRKLKSGDVLLICEISGISGMAENLKRGG